MVILSYVHAFIWPYVHTHNTANWDKLGPIKKNEWLASNWMNHRNSSSLPFFCWWSILTKNNAFLNNSMIHNILWCTVFCDAQYSMIHNIPWYTIMGNGTGWKVNTRKTLVYKNKILKSFDLLICYKSLLNDISLKMQ